jgi:8-oxo-dGTP pyrophosphatase MutT (NUDIX family)
MNFENKENKCHVTLEGEEVWDSRSVAVVGMILMRHEGEIYVVIGKRGEASPNEIGKWCMPCGYLDKNETCEEAVVREVWEESGFNCYKAIEQYNVLHDQMHFPWRIHSIPDTDIQNVSMHYALYVDSAPTIYRDIARLPDLTIENNAIVGEVDEVKWVKVSDLGLYDMAFNHKSTINIFISNLDSEIR